ncbi:MAG TPA: acetyl-CoA C-acyltransferase [Steroidobacteraceae bacterium]|nr:acetyl-CoA C-acyltransferase [Steroidobacteraceae bacterium]
MSPVSPPEVLIVASRRTPIGAFQGAFASVSAPALAAEAIRATLADAGIGIDQIDEVLLGCVLSAGIGQAPARQAALTAGVPIRVPCTTISKVCGSGMKAVMMGADAIRAGSAALVMAGGMESMTNAPYLLAKARSGYRLGHGELLDHMFLDGLQNAYDGKLMGVFAEATVRRYGFTRADQDAYVAETIARARAAGSAGAFTAELAPVCVKSRKGELLISEDEIPPTCDPAKLAGLKPAFDKDGTVTAASSSSIADGAAALLLAGAAEVKRLSLAPLARIVAATSFAQEPEWFTTAPVGAIRRVLERAGWRLDEVDLFEINEAFAVVTMAAIRDLALDPKRVNVNGGACALGHPIGASGARILTTLVHALRRRGLRRGVAALCIGGGEATAVAVELA